MNAEGAPDGWSVVWLDEVDSTNDFLRKGAYEHGTVVVAKRQTNGRGRRQNRWHSVEGESLTFSVFLRPDAAPAFWSRLSLAAGLAVAETLEQLGYEVGVKWPNDLWIRGRKVGGILVESSDDGAVVGIGLNLNMKVFEPGVDGTSLLVEDGRSWDVADVLDMLLPPLANRCRSIEGGFGEILDGIQQRCVLTGHEVVLRTSQGEMAGQVLRIGRQGELVIQTMEGSVPVIQAEEIRLL